jgi:hypothetical protein
MPKWARALFIGIGVLLIAGSIFYYVSASRRAAAAEEWPETTGRVVATRIEVDNSTDSDGDTSTSYDAIVSYEYAVAGRTYRSDRLYLNETPLFSDEGDARAFLAEYPVGTPVEVYYDPASPGDAAVIIEGPSWAISIVTLFGLIFAAVGWFFPADRPLRRLRGVEVNFERR